MADAFVPVDLDKLLDDFEQQDSSSSVSSQRQSSVVSQGLASTKTISTNGLPPDTSSRDSKEDCNYLLMGAASDSACTNGMNHAHGKLTSGLLSGNTTVSDSNLSGNAVPQANGETKHNMKPEQSELLSSTGMNNVMDLTDGKEELSRPSSVSDVDLLGNVWSQSDPALSTPDITSGITDKRTSGSQNDLPSNGNSGNLTNNLHQDLLLLDIDNCNRFRDGINENNVMNKGGTKPTAVQDSMQDSSRSLLDMPVHGSTSHGENEHSLIDLTTEDTSAADPAVFSHSGSNLGNTVEISNQNLLDMDNEMNDNFSTNAGRIEMPGNAQTSSANHAFMSQTSLPVNMLEPQTSMVPGMNSSTSNDYYNIDARTSDYHGTGDDFSHAGISQTAPSFEEGESSLLFMLDHFGNSMVTTELPADQNTPVFINNEANTPGTDTAGQSNDETAGTQDVEGETIPVAQDVVTEASEGSLHLGNSYEVLESEQSFQLGYNAPPWLADSNVSRCMSCQCKFTMVKRRHHCRACGKIYCSACCNLKFNLQYLDDKLARVCQACANVLLQRQAALTNRSSVSSTDEAAMYVYLNPEEPQAAAEESPASHDVQDIVSQVEQPPDYEATEAVQTCTPVEVAAVVPVFPEDVTGAIPQVTDQFRSTTCSSSSSLSSADIQVTSTVPLPPLLRKTDDGLKIDDSPNHQELLYLLKKRNETVTFLLNKNLVVKVKIVKLNCCVKRKCWCFSSEGMQAADQEDMVILLECVPKESSIPQDVLSHFNTAFAYAKQGHRVTDLGYTIFGQPFLGSLRNAGFLYIKSSFQCLDNLVLPSGPHIFGILIQREEVSWVQLFPIRLLLRLGAQYRYYPCPLWSVRDREALYGDIGHTIMDLLADFKNFQYTLPRVTGMHVHLEDKKVAIQLPQNRYDEVLKVLNATDEYVMAFEATFSNVADSHLVCIQEGTGYKTQAINLEGQERKVTGASFVVFNGALKSTTDLKAKVSIVEDGVMVQMIKPLSEEVRQAMREMSDFTVYTGCPESDSSSVQEVVFEWVSKRNPDIQSVLSPIDGLTLGTTSDIKINTHFDFSTPSIYRLRWTHLFFLERSGERPRNLPAQFKQTTADIAKACIIALRPYLYNLYHGEKWRIGLRVNLNPDRVGYVIGSQSATLPDEITNNLDNDLVPAVHNAVNPSSNAPTSMEFLFNIVEMLS